jgi:hypothetical protein
MCPDWNPIHLWDLDVKNVLMDVHGFSRTCSAFFPINLDDVMYSPNNRLKLWFHPYLVDHTTVWNNHGSLFCVSPTGPSYWFIYTSCRYNTKHIQWLTSVRLSSLSYSLSPIITDNGEISDVFVISG